MRFLVPLSTVLLFLLLFVGPAKAQSPSAELRGSSISVMGEVGGPAGAYTLGVEHLFVRTSTLQLGMYVGGSYGRELIWDGTAHALTAGVVGIHRIGAIGSQPLALEGGLGATRIHSEFDTGAMNWSTSYRPYLSGTLRLESSSGRVAYRLGAVVFSDQNDPFFMLPVLGIRVGL